MIISTTLKNKEVFSRYGKVVSFDFTYNIFRDKSSRGNDYRLGILSGISGSSKILPFAFVVVD
jgi:hypothetical protein